MVTVLGLCFGSFFNVLIARLPNDESIIRPGSKCPKCGHALSWFENIPVLSWVALRGRCRYCRTPISWQYPLVELLTALASALVAWRFGCSWQLAAALPFTWTLIAASGIDVRGPKHARGFGCAGDVRGRNV